MPERIQLRRTKGWRKPEGAIVVTRGTDWGNPFVVGRALSIETPTPFDKRAREAGTWYHWGTEAISREVAVHLFRVWISLLGAEAQIRRELGDHDLACWCPLDQPCHADVLLEIANP